MDRSYEHRREVDAGREAKAALELVRSHTDAIRAAAVEGILASKPDDVALRERLIVTAQIVDYVRAALEQAVIAGEGAQHRLLLEEQVTHRR